MTPEAKPKKPSKAAPAPTSQLGHQPDRLLTIAEVAARYGVSDQTVRRWAIKGAIAYVVVGPYRLKRIPQAEVERLVQPAPANAR